MSVEIVLGIKADAFELGRILGTVNELDCRLETLVPLGEAAVPFVRIHPSEGDSFEAVIEEESAVSDVSLAGEYDGEALYTIAWEAEDDPFFRAIREFDGHVLAAHGRGSSWEFTLYFPNHELVSAFNDRLATDGVDVEIKSVANPRMASTDAIAALTNPQLEALQRAVEAGYYDIPRRISTSELAAEFGISDQALTERLRRGIVTLARHTLVDVDDGA